MRCSQGGVYLHFVNSDNTLAGTSTYNTYHHSKKGGKHNENTVAIIRKLSIFSH